MVDKTYVVGMDAESEGEQVQCRSKASVIADDGFQSNPDLVREYISQFPERLFPRNSGTGKGDGLKMAQAVDAATIGLNRFYGHVLSRDAFHNALLWPYPYCDVLTCAGIVVNGEGRRFVDEGSGYGGVYVVR